MDRVGTWETSRRPQSPQRSRGHDRKSRRRSCWGRREESDGCVIPMKPRTKPTTNRRRREWREGGRSKGRRVATHAPDSEPGWRVTEAASLRIGGVQNPRSRLTFDESPVRESCTPGSVGEVSGNRHLYPTSGTPVVLNRRWARSVSQMAGDREASQETDDA